MNKPPALKKITLPAEVKKQLTPQRASRASTTVLPSSAVRRTEHVRRDTVVVKEIRDREKFRQDSTLLAMQLELERMKLRSRGPGAPGTGQPSVTPSGGKVGNVTVVGSPPRGFVRAGSKAVKALKGAATAGGAWAAGKLFMRAHPVGRAATIAGPVAKKVLPKLTKLLTK